MELGEDLIRGNHLAALSFVVAAGNRGVEARAFGIVQIVAVVEDRQIDLRTLGSIVGFDI